MTELNFESFDDALRSLEQMAQKMGLGRKGKNRRIERVRLEAELDDGDLDIVFNALADGAGSKGSFGMFLFRDKLIVGSVEAMQNKEVKKRLVNQIIKQNLC